MRKTKKINNAATFGTVRERALYFREISFNNNNVKKYKIKEKDKLCAKVKECLQNSLSFLCLKKYKEVKDKYAWGKVDIYEIQNKL